MKKIILLIICLFSLSVYAETREEKLEKVALFTKNFILKTIEDRHYVMYIEGSGTARIEPYHEMAGTESYHFDSAGFISFMFKKTLGILFICSDLLGGNPYYFTHYLTDTKNFSDVTSRNGVDANELKSIKDKLQTGDLILVKNYRNVDMYLGNDEIAEFSKTVKLGYAVSQFDEFTERLKDGIFVVIRIKDEILPETVNTKIRWIDTKKEEDLVLNDKPKINIDPYSEEIVKEMVLKINFKDIDGLVEINIDKNNINDKKIVLNKETKYEMEYSIQENGQYKISVKDSLGNESIKELNINNIDNTNNNDNTGPIINKLYYSDNYLIIEASDNESGLHDEAYSFDNCYSWTKDNKIKVEKEDKYHVCVRDKMGNITEREIDTINHKKLWILIPIIVIIIVFIVLIIIKK